MAKGERWVPVLGYEIVFFGHGDWRVCRKGRKHLRETIPDSEVHFYPIAQCTSHDDAVEVLRAMRGAMPENPN